MPSPRLNAVALAVLALASCKLALDRPLYEEGAVVGRAVSGVGLAPVAGARVSLVGASDLAITAADGTFAFHKLPGAALPLIARSDSKGDGLYDLAAFVQLCDPKADSTCPATANNGATWQLHRVEGGGDRVNGLDLGDVVLKPVGRVTGKVVQGGAPVAGARVAVVDLPFATTTDADGTFTLALLPAGDFQLAAAAAGHAALAPATVHVPVGAAADVGAIDLGASASSQGLSAQVATVGNFTSENATLHFTPEPGLGDDAYRRGTPDAGSEAFEETVPPTGQGAALKPHPLGLYRVTATLTSYFAADIPNVPIVSDPLDLATQPSFVLTPMGSASGETFTCDGQLPTAPTAVPASCACGVGVSTTGDAFCDAMSKDADGDGVPDATDDCPHVPNPSQKDAKMNGIGDACRVTISCGDATAILGVSTTLATCTATADNAKFPVTYAFTQTSGPALVAPTVAADGSATATFPVAGTYSYDVLATQAGDPAQATFAVTVSCGADGDCPRTWKCSAGACVSSCPNPCMPGVDSACAPSGLCVPQAPTSLALTPGDGSVALAWDPTPGATAYQRYSKTCADAAFLKAGDVVTASGTGTQRGAVSGLTNGVCYAFAVTAIDAMGEGLQQSPPPTGTPARPCAHDADCKLATWTCAAGVCASACTPACVMDAESACVAPAECGPQAPLNVVATPAVASAELAWDAYAGATDYSVYYADSATAHPERRTKYAKQSAVAGQARQGVLVTSLVPDTTYFFWVTATVGAGNEGLMQDTPASATPTLEADGGTSDGGTSDGGTSDGGGSDGGTTDGGTSDGGTSDGGTTDGGS